MAFFPHSNDSGADTPRGLCRKFSVVYSSSEASGLAFWFWTKIDWSPIKWFFINCSPLALHVFLNDSALWKRIFLHFKTSPSPKTLVIRGCGLCVVIFSWLQKKNFGFPMRTSLYDVVQGCIAKEQKGLTDNSRVFALQTWKQTGVKWKRTSCGLLVCSQSALRWHIQLIETRTTAELTNFVNHQWLGTIFFFKKQKKTKTKTKKQTVLLQIDNLKLLNYFFYST